MNLLPFAVVGASVLGSAHCVAMCGGLVLSVAKDRKSLIAYHLGRLLSYCALGALAGLAGERAFALSDSLGWVAAGALSVVLIFMGVRVWRGENVHLFRTPGWILNRAFRGAAQDPFLVGLFSGLLPCGWLHLFVVGALATRSAPLGA
ncbi:MAG: sulfite exporter TauE/SafE family protein, partial [Bdellovibrionota bacterium]